MEYINLYIGNFFEMFVSMSMYIMIGLLFVGILNTYVKKEKVIGLLGTNNFGSVVKSACVGVPLPLCSCGVVPTAVGLKESGASNGAVVSFLISTPQTGVDSIFATYSMMGIVMAIFRPIAAFFSGIFGGIAVNILCKKEKLNTVDKATSSCCSSEKVETKQAESGCCCSATATSNSEPTHSKVDCCHTADSSKTVDSAKSCCSEPITVQTSSCCSTQKQEDNVKGFAKFKRVFTYAFGKSLDDIAVHFLVGLVLASLIATFVPADLFVNLGLSSGILSMLAMVVIGLPMYICSTSSIPIALSLIAKGLSPGSAFVFLFVGPVTNIASLLILNKTLGKKITIVYLVSVILCAIGFGYLLEFIATSFNLVFEMCSHSHSHGIAIVSYALAGIFAVLIVISLIGKIIKKAKTKFKPKSQ